MTFPANARLYGILDLGYVRREDALVVARQMLGGGVGVLQLRGKQAGRADIAALGKSLAPLCRDYGVPFLLNDHADLVRETGADGVHVGQEDLSVNEARSLLGDGALIGLSTHSCAQALAALECDPDYIGFGPLFATPTKPDYTPIGTQDIRSVHEEISLPIFCIGGVKKENLPGILAAGARRVVIVSGILTAASIADYCRECLALLEQTDL